MKYCLTKEGRKFLKNGLPEKNLLEFILSKGGRIGVSDIKNIEDGHIAIMWAKKNGWMDVSKKGMSITDEGKRALEEKSEIEKALESEERSAGQISILESRKLISKFSEDEGEISRLTSEMIKSGSWETAKFKPYTAEKSEKFIYPGKKQVYKETLENLKMVLAGMGFSEMKGNFVEMNFWDCDALFLPQDHPARGIHDIYFIKGLKGAIKDKELVKKVKETHEKGWDTGSKGWGGKWSEEDAKKVIMRSQNTATSARKLYEHGDRPGKFFSISRVFRPDVIDAKHLLEFFQCEGIVIGEDLNFRHLLGLLKSIGERFGFKDFMFKPGYFPMTEPSVEMFAKHPKLGWMEVAGAGMFRPEVLKPLGIEKSQVLAWGIGIDRLAMISLGIDDIRHLFSNDIKWLRDVPMEKSIL